MGDRDIGLDSSEAMDEFLKSKTEGYKPSVCDDDKELSKKDFLNLPGTAQENEVISETKEADDVKLSNLPGYGKDRAMLNNNAWSIRMHQVGSHSLGDRWNPTGNPALRMEREIRNKVFTGHEEVDKILNLPVSQLPKHSPLIMMWGCNRCFARGTPDCPHGIMDKQTHENGYCDSALKGKLVQYTLMKTANGMKHLRNVNIMTLQEMMQHYLGKLNLFKDYSKISKAEAYLMKQVIKILDKLGERLDNAIKQEEGVIIKTEKKLTPAEINDLLSQARNSEKVIEAEVVEEKGGDGNETVTS